jgi:hypothetical protein
MKSLKNNNVLREIRRIRNKHYKETKNMSLEERMEYYHRKAESVDKKLAELNLYGGKDVFPFLDPQTKPSNEKGD